LSDRVGWLLILQSLKDGLIFDCDLDKVALSLLPVQTADLKAFWIVKFGFGVLHDVGHLFEEDFVFTFDFCVFPLLISALFGLANGLVVRERWAVESFAHCTSDCPQVLLVDLLVSSVPPLFEQLA